MQRTSSAANDESATSVSGLTFAAQSPPAARHRRARKAAICSRVTFSAGEYVVGEVPVVMPRW